ncbi:MAG: hypothetical protein AVDCRST_MAG73-3299 [uncultured Thermomicrobiales bacterium]|uniref:Methyltransferase type 11 domain-containing protein n=1 Tax=uncultured Thermomicrobiales bacterium TaxID=1645740 RepID=A0A6J4URK2_9BACT|nr:MAG: hypothetical protein AVDCRST_MAG73-3299 [uncultured Thermomicrobiales bacterium]
MANSPGSGVWGGTDGYEAYMGRWSRPMARAFIAWFAVPAAGRWLDVGCGTGALSAAVLDAADPSAVLGIDPSPEFVETATARVTDPRARFEVGDARALPVATDRYDAVVAGLVLNHVPDPTLAVAEMARAAHPGGAVGAYVWDYGGEMQLMRHFWDAVGATDADAATHDPRAHYHICRPDPLAALFRAAGLSDVEVGAIDLPMDFRDLDDYWLPHTLAGPAGPQRYVSALDDERKAALRERLRFTLPTAADGTIALIGRAWAARGWKRTG